MARPKPSLLFALLSAGTHVAVAWALAMGARAPVSPAQEHTEPVLLFEIDEEPASAWLGIDPVEATEHESAGSAAAAIARVEPPGARLVPPGVHREVPRAAEAGANEPVGRVAGSAPSGWTFSPFSNSQPLQLSPPPSGAASIARAERVAPPSRPEREPDIGGLREGLAQQQRERGGGRGGPAVSAAHAASRLAPESGSVLLVFTFDASGSPSHMQVPAGASAEWSRYAQEVFEQLKKKPRRPLPPGKREMVVSLAVESTLALPSGASAGGKLQLEGTGGRFDLSDVGASAKKRLQARVVRESVR